MLQKKIQNINNKFTYQHFEQNRYEISDFNGYECLCNNGFIKLYTIKGRAYWHAQNQCIHEIMDWKFHISMKDKYLKEAWNMLINLFIQMQCRSGMKCIYLKQNEHKQKGREITIYIMKWSEELQETHFGKQYGIGLSDQHSTQFWHKMFVKIEQMLKDKGFESNGLAQGDLPLGYYISLRNQAFIVNNKGQYEYPPNHYGWNPLSQPLPFPLQKFRNQQNILLQKIQKRNYFLPLIFVIVGFTSLIFWNYSILI